MRRLVILVALVASGCASASAGPAGHPTTPAPSGRTALLAHLSILRRPATQADSSPALRATLTRLAHGGCESLVADPGYTRLAAVTRDGTRVYVVAFKPASCVPHCTGTARMCIRPLPRVETVAVLAGVENFPAISTLADLKDARAVAANHSWRFVLVPDGVVRVTLQITGTGKPYAVTATVHNNVAVLRAPKPGTMLWLNASGQTVTRAPLY